MIHSWPACRSCCREEFCKKGVFGNSCPLTLTAETVASCLQVNELHHSQIQGILISFQNSWFFRTPLSKCVSVFMNFYFCWDIDLFFHFQLFSGFFFHGKDTTKSLTVWTFSPYWWDTPSIMFCFVSFGGRGGAPLNSKSWIISQEHTNHSTHPCLILGSVISQGG